MSAAVGIAIHRIGPVSPPRRARFPICIARSLRFNARATRLPKNGITAGETTVTPSGVGRARRAYDRSLRTIRGTKSLFERPGKPIEIEFTKITRLPALAKRRIKWYFECGWWYHQSSPAKQIIECP